MDDGDTTANENEFAGSFHSIPGKYICTGTCTATADNEGNLMTFDGQWTFTPDAAPDGSPHKIYGVIPDADHIHFGYWLQTTPAVDEDPITYAVQAFSGGLGDYTMSREIAGVAKYDGRAAGHYVRKTLKSNGDLASAFTGESQAKANLTASFGGTTVAVANAFSIEGTVTDFRDGGTMLDGWTVELMSETFGDTESSFTDGVTTGTGAWTAKFFGDRAVDAQPTGVAGEFNAHFSNGHVAGAYGAAIVEE